jgi:predicted glycoside hydrolase/deacetylase ChbG (UPF0249 family)
LPVETLAPQEKVCSLLAGNGDLFPPADKAKLLAQSRLDEVNLELRSQIETVLATGLLPTHLDWHALAEEWTRGDLRSWTCAAEEYRLAARVWLDRSRRQAQQHRLR